MITGDKGYPTMDLGKLLAAFRAAPGPVARIRMNRAHVDAFRRALPDGCTNLVCGARGPDQIHRGKGGEAAHGLAFNDAPIECAPVAEPVFLTPADLAAEAAAADAPALAVSDDDEPPPAA